MREKAWQVVVLIPSLEPDDRLPAYVDRLRERGFPRVVVVDDGSSAASQSIFESLGERPGVTVLHHEVNRGKGVALKTGYRWIEENLPDCDGVLTAEGEGGEAVLRSFFAELLEKLLS